MINAAVTRNTAWFDQKYPTAPMPAAAPESRSDRKERTRRAILDAALALTEDVGLAGLSLRQVAKEVGIVPTAFYRHFASIAELGLALVRIGVAVGDGEVAVDRVVDVDRRGQAAGHPHLPARQPARGAQR